MPDMPKVWRKTKKEAELVRVRARKRGYHMANPRLREVERKGKEWLANLFARKEKEQ